MNVMKLTVVALAGSITRAYRSLIDQPNGIVCVAEDAYGPFAYVVGLGADNGRRRAAFQVNALRPRRSWVRRLASLPFRAWRHRQHESALGGDHGELLSVGVVEAFADSGAHQALAEAFIRAVAARGGGRVRASVDPGDLATINMLRSVGFTNGSSPDRLPPLTDLWAHIS